MSTPGPPRRPLLPAGLGPGPPGARRRMPTAPSPHRACRRRSRRAATAGGRPGRGHRGAHAAAPLPNAGKRLRGLVRAGGKNSRPRASPATGRPPPAAASRHQPAAAVTRFGQCRGQTAPVPRLQDGSLAYSSYQQEKNHCEYLHPKLSHIKSLILQFETRGTS